MAISSETSSIRYTGNGALDTYAYTFKIADDDDLEVKVRNTSTNVETTLTKTTDYTVDGVGESAGGNVALVNSSQAWLDGDGDLLSTYVLSIRRKPSVVQPTSIRNQDDYYPDNHEDAFDYLCYLIQSNKFKIDRSVKLIDTILTSQFDPTLPTDIVGKDTYFLGTNTAGTAWDLYSADDILSDVINGGPFAITDGMAATSVTNMTVDGADYSSAKFLVEVIRSTTIHLIVEIVLVDLNGTWTIHEGISIGSGDHGLTFTVTESSNVAQVKIASDSTGTGTLKFKRMAFDV